MAPAYKLHPDRFDAREHLACIDFARFVRHTWSIVEPSKPLVWNWHLDVLCRALQHGLEHGGNLVIAIPPGYAKSRICSVFLPSSAWLRDPAERMLYFSGTEVVLHRDARDCRQIIRSSIYRRLVARRLATLCLAQERGENPELLGYSQLIRSNQPWRLAKDADAVRVFGTTCSGMRYSRTTRSDYTGIRGRIAVVDDPIDVQVVTKLPAHRQDEEFASCLEDFDVKLSTRLDKQKAFQVVIAQRLHMDDLPGMLFKRKDWHSIVIPEEFNPDLNTSSGIDDGTGFPVWTDPRTERGELLFPAYVDRSKVDDMKRRQGRRQYAAQFGQDPAPARGGMLAPGLAACKRYLDSPKVVVKEQGLRVSIIADLSLGSQSRTASFCCIQAWGYKGALKWLLWETRGKWRFPEAKRQLIRAATLWHEQTRCIIEAKASGQPAIDDLEEQIPFLEGYNPGSAGKEQRAEVAASGMEAGNIWVPHPDNPFLEKVTVEYSEVLVEIRAAEGRGERWPAEVEEDAAGNCRVPWVVDWRMEHARFPAGRNDDRVDCSSMAAECLGRGRTAMSEQDQLKSQFGGMLAEADEWWAG